MEGFEVLRSRPKCWEAFTSLSLRGSAGPDIQQGPVFLDGIYEFVLDAFIFMILPLFLVRFSGRSPECLGDIGAAARVYSER